MAETRPDPTDYYGLSALMNGTHGDSVKMSTLVECCGCSLGLLLALQAPAVIGFLPQPKNIPSGEAESPRALVPFDVTLNEGRRITREDLCQNVG